MVRLDSRMFIKQVNRDDAGTTGHVDFCFLLLFRFAKCARFLKFLLLPEYYTYSLSVELCYSLFYKIFSVAFIFGSERANQAYEVQSSSVE